MPSYSLMVPDPGIEYGHYKVLQRTDRKWIVFDTKAPCGKGTVALFKSKAGAEARAKALHEAESSGKNGDPYGSPGSRAGG